MSKSTTLNLNVPIVFVFTTLVVLKLMGLITLSWLWVAAPLWFVPAIAVSIVVGFVVVAVLITLLRAVIG